MSLYLPTTAIQKNEQVLIADDVLRSGETQRALLNLAERSGAKICGIFMVITVGEVELVGEENFYSLVNLQ
jgi:adenine phosphoribosyltransferase